MSGSEFVILAELVLGETETLEMPATLGVLDPLTKTLRIYCEDSALIGTNLLRVTFFGQDYFSHEQVSTQFSLTILPLPVVEEFIVQIKPRFEELESTKVTLPIGEGWSFTLPGTVHDAGLETRYHKVDLADASSFVTYDEAGLKLTI